MAQRIEAPEIIVPAGTTLAIPQTTDLDWQSGTVVRVEIVIPPGPSGLVGFQVGHSGQVILPRNPNNWIVTDSEHINWDVDDYPTGAAWFVRAYNVDIYEHALYFRFHIDELTTRTSQPVPLLDIVQPDMPAVVYEP